MKTRIVIAGGGFAGLYAAMHLDKTLARNTELEVVLISRENFIFRRRDPLSKPGRPAAYPARR